MVVGDINDTMIHDKCDEMHSQFKNPFHEFYNWVWGECDDIESLYEAIKARDNMQVTRNKLENKKRSDESSLEKLNQGKKTLKTLFKGSSGR